MEKLPLSESPRSSEESVEDVTAPLVPRDDDFEQKERDLESQDGLLAPIALEEKDAGNSSLRVAVFLVTYFVINVSLTIYNKQVLGSFAFPWILTAVHSSIAALGSYAVHLCGYFELTKLNQREKFVLAMFSFLFTLNIAMSNVALEMVSVPFHQVTRATCPVWTIFIYRTVFKKTYAWSIYLSIVPIILGVGIATYGDYYFSALGFVVALVGVMLSAIKGVVTNRLMTGKLRLAAFEVLLRMCPLAALQSLAYSVIIGEFSAFLTYTSEGHLTRSQILIILGNGVLAFMLNVVSFQTNKLAGALSMTICANLKQCFTIALGAALWHVPMGLVNAEGIVLTVVGAAWYSSVEYREKIKRHKRSGSAS